MKSKLTINEKQIKIAQRCGWTQIENANPIVLGGMWKGYPPENAIVGKKDLLLNYFGDLNHSAIMEKSLKDKLLYRFILSQNSDGRSAKYMTFEDAMCHATAEERAEAFGKCEKLW